VNRTAGGDVLSGIPGKLPPRRSKRSPRRRMTLAAIGDRDRGFLPRSFWRARERLEQHGGKDYDWDADGAAEVPLGVARLTRVACPLRFRMMATSGRPCSSSMKFRMPSVDANP